MSGRLQTRWRPISKPSARSRRHPATRSSSGAGRLSATARRWPAAARAILLRDSAGEIAGFALVQGFGDEDLKRHLKRIAVRDPGRGAGAFLLSGFIERIFAETETNRIDLDVFLDNDRARRAYEKAGFREEGVLRDWHRNADGSFRTVRLMSILRRDWEQQRG